MATHIWTVLSERSKIEEKSNVLSLDRVVENVGVNIQDSGRSAEVAQLIVLPVNWSLVSFLRVQEGETFIIHVDYVTPWNEVKRIATRKMSPPKKGDLFARHILTVQDIGVRDGGLYRFQVSIQGSEDSIPEVVGVIPFNVTVDITAPVA
ncbi:MAG TPA: hypothetical protein VLA04_00640 [Verrucomicrobiae bacterium]|nr:hypothetical protein [Verrucomicrobiae bacterium]